MARTTQGLCALLLAASTAMIGQAFAAAPQYPQKPVRIIVPYPPGASGDLVARMIAQRLNENLGQLFIIDNRPGGAGIAGTDAVAKAAPDGYTLLLTAMNHTTNSGLFKSLPYDTAGDFTAISLLGSVPLALIVHPSTGFKSAKDMIAAAKAKPNTLRSASGGNGTGGHLSMEVFSRATNIKLVHVPYKGATPAVIGVVQGEVEMSFAGIPPTLVFIKEGKLIPLLVTTANRAPSLPNVPTAQETGVTGYDVDVWFGLLGRAGTPAPIIKLLAMQSAVIVNEPGINARMLTQGFVPVGSTPEAFEKIIRRDLERWPRIIREAGIKAD